MTPQIIAKYQALRSRILSYQRPLIVKPLTSFQRAVLSATCYANASR